MLEREQEQLLAWLDRTLRWEGSATSVRRISEGHSREMVVVAPEGFDRVVVRIEQGGVFGTNGSEECRVMSALHSFDVPIAEIVARDLAGEVMGRPFFVMKYVDHDDKLPSPVDDFITVLDRLHHIDVSDARFAEVFALGIPPDARTATIAQVHRWRDIYRSAVDRPNELLELAAIWLEKNAPHGDAMSIVHGDAGPGNFVHDGKKVVALTDWEFSHVGNRLEDWVFCIQMRGSRALPKDEWFGKLEAATGIVISKSDWLYWETFNYFKGSCANITCRRLYETGINPAPNMAIVGTALHRMFLRRVVELIDLAN